MLKHTSSGGKDIQCIELFSLHWTIEEEVICIDVGDLILEWYPPKFVRWTALAFEYGSLLNGDPGGAAIVDVDLCSVADGGVYSIVKLAATKERFVGEVWDDVYCAFRLA